MANYDPNPQQRDFLLSKDCNVLVSASAGSGKTSTMIQKLIQILITEKISITDLLVVTYTNAAASEIKLKLFDEITKLIKVTNDTKEKVFLEKQLENLDNAEIGTLHAICKKLIVKFFYELEQSPDFALLSDKEQKYLLDMAVNNVFSKHISSNDEEFFELYDCYNSKRNDAHLKRMVLQLYEYKISKIDYDAWKTEFLSSSYNTDLENNSAGKLLLDYYKNLLKSYMSTIKNLQIEAEVNGYDKYLFFFDARKQFIDEFEKLHNFVQAVKVLSSINLPNKPSKQKNGDVNILEFDFEVEKFSKEFSETIKKMKDDMCVGDISEIEQSLNSAKNNVEKLFAIVDEIDHVYTEIKINRNVLDFNDLEDKMLLLLQNQKIQEVLKEKYQYIFVDEYQDINDKQENILQSLVSKNNFYMIGDVKQSIYAFRQSSPKIFVNKYNQFSLDGVISKVINFNTNYRSDKNILEFANQVFDKIITKDTIGIDYKDARFDSKRHYNGCNVSLNIIRSSDEIEDKEEIEANLIVKEIANIKKIKKDDGSFYDYKDIAIILRQRGSFLKTLCSVLTKNQIPIKTSINSDFFDTAEVQLMISILKVISNPHDDISVAIVLKQLFDFSEEELMQVRAVDFSALFYQCVFNYAADDNIKSKINNFKTFLKDSRVFLTHFTISEYLEKVLEKYQVLLKVKAQDDGIEKSNNILEFIKISNNDNYKNNLDKFLDYLKIISKDSNLKVIGNNDNAVEICTIHHSKGLEYPVVILGRLGAKFQLNKDSGNIIINGNFGVGLKSINSIDRTSQETIVRNAIRVDNITSEINEEIRLLYVAMTRAKEKLSLVGMYNIDNFIKNKQKYIYSNRNYLDLIFKSFDNSCESLMANKKSFSLNAGKENELVVNMFDCDDLNNVNSTSSNSIILDAINSELKDSMVRVFNEVPNTSTITIKNTVTNILKEENDYENINYIPNKLDVSDKVPSIDYLKLGTAYHTIMQEIKFTENKEEIEKLINSLVVRNLISNELAELIKIEEIEKAITILKNLIINAKDVYREKQFLLCENYNKLTNSTDNNTKVIVQGVIDLVVVRDDGVYIVDYKTNKGVTDKQLIDTYKLQIDLYSKAFESATNMKITHKYLYSFSLGKLIKIE